MDENDRLPERSDEEMSEEERTGAEQPPTEGSEEDCLLPATDPTHSAGTGGAPEPPRTISEDEANHDAAAFELFRRAFDEQDSSAWEEIACRYLRMIIQWCGYNSSEAEMLAWETLGNFWLALRKRSIAQDFAHVGGLFRYLRLVAITTLQKHRRREGRHRGGIPLDIVGLLIHNDLIPLESSLFWRWIEQWLSPPALTLQERLLWDWIIRQNLPLIWLVQQFPTLFPTTHEVSKVKERLLKRLRRRLGGSVPPPL